MRFSNEHESITPVAAYPLSCAYLPNGEGRGISGGTPPRAGDRDRAPQRGQISLQADRIEEQVLSQTKVMPPVGDLFTVAQIAGLVANLWSLGDLGRP